MQAVQEPPSIRHSKVEPPSLAVKEKSAFAELLGSLGCAVIVVFGAAVSIVQVKLAGRRVGVAGGVGRADLEGVGAVGEAGVALRRWRRPSSEPPSIRHSKVEPPSLAS